MRKASLVPSLVGNEPGDEANAKFTPGWALIQVNFDPGRNWTRSRGWVLFHEWALFRETTVLAGS